MADIALVQNGTRTGLRELSWTEYLAYPGLNPSTIVHGLKSMRHLKWAWDHEGKDTDAMKWGRALHCLLFEPSKFEHRYRCWEGRRAGNEYKEFAAQAFLDGAEVLKSEGRYSMAAVLEAGKTFVEDPLIQPLIAHGKAEVTVFAVEHGLQCRGRIDWLSTDTHTLVDLKTAKNVLARPFGYDFYKFHYDLKLGLYRRWLRKATGEDWPVEVICLESEPPYDTTVVPIPEAVLERGERIGLEIIEETAACIGTGVWNGVAAGQRYFLDTPMNQMDDLEGAEEMEDEDGE